MPLSAPEYWLEWTKNYFRCQFTHIGGLIHKKNAPQSTPIWFVAFWKFDRALGRLTTAFSVFVNSTNITTNIETAVLSKWNRRKLQNEQNWFFRLLTTTFGKDNFWKSLMAKIREMRPFCWPPFLQGYSDAAFLSSPMFTRQSGQRG